MSIADRKYDSRLSFGSRVNPLVILIAISMILFVVLAFFKAFTYIRFPEGSDVDGYFSKNILSWFALSTDTQALVSRPWTILSSAFVHTAIWPLFANMLWLWLFSYIFIDLTGNRKLIPVFIYASLAGAVVFLIANSFMPPIKAHENYFYGCGPAILGIALAATTISPNYKLFPMLNGGISLWIIAILYLVIDLATLPANYPAVHIAHLSGGIAGFLFIFILRRGFDGSDWMNNFYDWLMNVFNPDKTTGKKSIIKNTFYSNSTTNLPYKKTLNLTQEKLDEILDKINLSGGYENLSEDEKQFLKRASQEELKDK